MAFTTVTYEEQRLSFFIDQRKHAEKRYKRLAKTAKPNDPYLSEVNFLLSEVGQELSFYDDAIRMFAEKLSEKKQLKEMMEGVW